MAESHWNRSARRSGGQQSAHIVLPRLSADDVLVIAQRERIRVEFGEEGVRRVDAVLQEHMREDNPEEA